MREKKGLFSFAFDAAHVKYCQMIKYNEKFLIEGPIPVWGEGDGNVTVCHHRIHTHAHSCH